MSNLGPFQQKWVDALRSGKYKQGKNALRTENDEFCCLGVLEDVMGTPCVKGGIGLVQTIRGNKYAYHHSKTDFSIGVLTRKTYEDLKITNRGQTKLIDMNDSGASFDEIADFIENNYDFMFVEAV